MRASSPWVSNKTTPPSFSPPSIAERRRNGVFLRASWASERRSRWRGATMSTRPGALRRNCSQHSAARASSPGRVLPNTRTGASGGMRRSARSAERSCSSSFGGALSNFVFPVTETFEASAPRAHKRSA